jgi:hypothetical protein
VRAVFAGDELRELGERLEARRAELRDKMRPAGEKTGILDKLAAMVGDREGA